MDLKENNPKYVYEDKTNIQQLQLCYEEGCTFVGKPKDFHDLYWDGHFYCPLHIDMNMVLGSEVEDIHVEPISCRCEARILSNPEYWVNWKKRETEREMYEEQRKSDLNFNFCIIL